MSQADKKPAQRYRDYSRRLDVHRWCDHPELNRCVGELIEQIDANAPATRARQRRASAYKSIYNAVSCIVLNLYAAWRTDPELSVAISLNRNSYTGESRYRKLYLKYDGMMEAYRGLLDLGYFQVVKEGFNDPVTETGRSTRIRATDKLFALLTGGVGLTLPAIWRTNGESTEETLLLRDENKRLVERYEETEDIQRMREELRTINALLADTWIDLHVPENEYHEGYERYEDQISAADAYRPPTRLLHVDFTERHLVRIFNNNRWDNGGRFYGGWWQRIPSPYRSHIHINGKVAVEVDFSGLHIEILYARTNAQLEGDAYDVGQPNVARGNIKRAVNALINSKNTLNSPPKDLRDAMSVRDWKKLVTAIQERHAPIQRFFGTGEGLRLQRLDADMAAEVMLHFAERGYPCLPVHDSFIVHNGLVDDLNEVMQQTYERRIGSTIRTKSELGAPAIRQGNGTVEPSLSKALEPGPAYEGYETRELEWMRYRVLAGQTG